MDTKQQQPIGKYCALATCLERGRHWVAIQHIPAGTVIFEEMPLISVPDKGNSSTQPWALAHLALKVNFDVTNYPENGRLVRNQWDRSDNLELANCPEEQRAQLRKLYGAMITYPVHAHDRSLGFYPTLAFLNHSCSPNARFVPLPGSKQVAIVATGDIAPGTEVTVAYVVVECVPPELARELTRMHLYQEFGFTCHCDACVRDH